MCVTVLELVLEVKTFQNSLPAFVIVRLESILLNFFFFFFHILKNDGTQILCADIRIYLFIFTVRCRGRGFRR